MSMCVSAELCLYTVRGCRRPCADDTAGITLRYSSSFPRGCQSLVIVTVLPSQAGTTLFGEQEREDRQSVPIQRIFPDTPCIEYPPTNKHGSGTWPRKEDCFPLQTGRFPRREWKVIEGCMWVCIKNRETSATCVGSSGTFYSCWIKSSHNVDS